MTREDRNLLVGVSLFIVVMTVGGYLVGQHWQAIGNATWDRNAIIAPGMKWTDARAILEKHRGVDNTPYVASEYGGDPAKRVKGFWYSFPTTKLFIVVVVGCNNSESDEAFAVRTLTLLQKPAPGIKRHPFDEIRIPLKWLNVRTGEMGKSEEED